MRISILDQATFGLVLGRHATVAGGQLPLPTFGMCLEVEGIDGFEDEPRNQYMKQPNPTNGVGTHNQAGFQDNYKKKHPRQIGY